ncbi:MAG: hypothetical protein RLZZ41_53 [Actinomycetota bacterium]|jgi:uncharacterized membrane protein YqgA involved in biofilm formation
MGSALGVLLGNRLPEKMSRTLTDAMGLIVLVIGALNLADLSDEAFAKATGIFPTILVVLAALLLGGVTGSLLKIEQRLEQFGVWLQAKTKGKGDKDLFIQGFVNAALLFTIGPMAVLGALQDGLGQGFEILALKSTLDGFTSVAFAATMGWGVAFSAIPVGLWQGLLTILSTSVGDVLSQAAVASITATGGILLLGTGLRVLQIRMVSVADLLPALVFAPVITLVLATTLGQ